MSPKGGVLGACVVLTWAVITIAFEGFGVAVWLAEGRADWRLALWSALLLPAYCFIPSLVYGGLGGVVARVLLLSKAGSWTAGRWTAAGAVAGVAIAGAPFFALFFFRGVELETYAVAAAFVALGMIVGGLVAHRLAAQLEAQWQSRQR